MSGFEDKIPEVRFISPYYVALILARTIADVKAFAKEQAMKSDYNMPWEHHSLYINDAKQCNELANLQDGDVIEIVPRLILADGRINPLLAGMKGV